MFWGKVGFQRIKGHNSDFRREKGKGRRLEVEAMKERGTRRSFFLFKKKKDESVDFKERYV